MKNRTRGSETEREQERQSGREIRERESDRGSERES